jgi:pimeloyl-ACP methyl ester carboxylesterase
MQPTIVLVHGAFAESASFDQVIDSLVGEGYTVICAPNRLRRLATDAAAVSDLVRTIEGPVVLAAHSYGGAVMSNVDPDAGDIVGLVYCNGFAADAGENPFQLAAMFPGSTLDEASVQPVTQADGTTDFYIKQERFHAQFCADVPVWQAELQHFLAERAGARRTIEIPGASHAITVSQPEATAQLILEAAAVRAAA